MNITHENIVELILDSKSRSDLLKAISLQNDNSSDIENAVSDAILNLKAIDVRAFFKFAIAKYVKTFYFRSDSGKFGSL